MDENDELKELFARAAEIASAVPENMQEAAFHRALDALQAELEDPEGSKSKQKPKTPKKSARAKQSTPAAAADDPPVDVVRLFNELDRDRAGAVDAETIGRDKAMALLRLAHDEFDVDGMSATEIATVLTEKFRWRVAKQSIGEALNGAGRMVDRVKTGRAVKFRLMAGGEKWLDSSPDDRGSANSTAGRKSSSQKAPTTATAPKKAKGPTKAAKSKRKKAQATNSSNSGGGGKRRVGPKAAVEALIASGYFSTAHTISEIQAMLEEQTARKFKPSDLSPTMVRLLRENALTRSKNSDGQYEYVAPGA